MVDITISGDNAVFEIEGWDKLWSLRSRLQIPLSHIKGAHVDPEPAMGWFSGIKVAGAGIPNVLKAGIFYQEGQIVFWDVHHPELTIVVDLEHEHFAKLVLEVADPQAAVKLLKGAISGRSA
jgi:hypothetical protein